VANPASAQIPVTHESSVPLGSVSYKGILNKLASHRKMTPEKKKVPLTLNGKEMDLLGNKRHSGTEKKLFFIDLSNR
jgi:hypothetical protein